MRTLISCSLLLTILVLPAQSETEISKTLYENFEKAYNLNDAQTIFDSFGDQMKQALPLENTSSFVDGLLGQVGKIQNAEFVGYQTTVAKYELTFERGKLFLFLSNDTSNKINGLLFRPYERPPKFERNQTEMILPFKDEWTVFWGGDNREQNYHVDYPNQRGAFDILIMDDQNKSYKNDGKTNDDYYVFGKELISPCDAKVVQVIDGVEDNVPGILNPKALTGNTVVLKTDNDEFLLFAHFKNGSIVLEEGQQIKQGDLMGMAGNSGNSSEAHLHFHIQDTEDFFSAMSSKCFFAELMVNGELQKDYSPVKGDRIMNPR